MACLFLKLKQKIFLHPKTTFLRNNSRICQFRRKKIKLKVPDGSIKIRKSIFMCPQEGTLTPCVLQMDVDSNIRFLIRMIRIEIFGLMFVIMVTEKMSDIIKKIPSRNHPKYQLSMNPGYTKKETLQS